jgi:hypothetical protein
MSTIRSTSHRLPRGMGITVLALGLAAMSPASVRAQTTEKPPAREEVATRPPRAQLVVESNNWLDVHLYLVRDGMTTSLGFMNGPGKATFELPSIATLPGAPLQFLVVPIGGAESHLTLPVNINSGDVAELTVQNDLSLSSVVVLPSG